MKLLPVNNYQTSVNSNQRTKVNNSSTIGFKNLTTYSKDGKVMMRLITKDAINSITREPLISAAQLDELEELCHQSSKAQEITVGPCTWSTSCILTLKREGKPDAYIELRPDDGSNLKPSDAIEAMLLLDKIKVSRQVLLQLVNNKYRS